MDFFWILIFLLSVALLVKSADWFVESAEKIGLVFKISPFIIGVTIVAAGTSFPELASGIAAVLRGSPEIVVANAIGSNIANILLIIGLSAVVSRRLIVKRSLIDLDAPLLATSTALFAFIILDKKIVIFEGILLLLAFIVYLLYTIFQRSEEDGEGSEVVEVLSLKTEKKEKAKIIKKKPKKTSLKIDAKTIFFLVLGIAGLIIGANYAIESMVKISTDFGVPTSLVAIIALAIGTSLPELVVSVRAASKKKYEIALGNVFGSNVFNLLLVVGIPGLIKPLVVDDLSFSIGFPFLVVATFLFILSGISRKIHIWEGAMYLLIYVLFTIKLIEFTFS